MSTSDFKLDARIRDVSLPSGLLERLMAIPYADDAGIDDVVRDVELPEGLLQRLTAIPLGDDDGLDQALRNVPVPDELEMEFRRHMRRVATLRDSRDLGRTLRISRIAMAASLLLAVSLSLGASLLLSWAFNRSGATLGPQVATKDTKPSVPKAELETSWRGLADDERVPGSDESNNDKAPMREMNLASLETAADRAKRDAIVDPSITPAHPFAEPTGPIPVYHRSWDKELEVPMLPAKLEPHGLDWPVVKGSNRQLLIEKGFNPFVVPAAGSPLQSCAVPLAIESASYELTRRYLERNELPPPSVVRTEDFLAALDYRFPQPSARGLGLTLAGGPSPMSGENFSLLQVGVQAWQGDAAHHAPVHLVVLVDTSASMRRGSRIDAVRRALSQLPDLAGPNDRLSLVTFNQAAHVLVENLGSESMSQFRMAAESLAAEGSTNFGGGLREAVTVGRESLGSSAFGQDKPTVRIVLLSDGLMDLDPAALEKIEKQVAESARQSMRLDVIDLGQQDADPQLAAMAKAGQGSVHRAASARQVGWALREIVTGRSQIVARSARLHVTFNPKAVLEYRLVGHESGDWAGLLPGPLETDFHEDQSATGLFEVRLNPNGEEEVAKVEISWYTADGDSTLAGKTVRKVVEVIHRSQFAGTLTSSAPCLQQAAVAAYTAEVLRHSPFIFVRHPETKFPGALHHAYEMAMDTDSRAANLPAFEEFIGLIRGEMKAHPPRQPMKN